MIDFYFNPRSRVGNDYIVCDISCYIANFNPRSRVGNDESGNRLLFCLLLFQSTFPRGERLTCRCQYALDLRISIHVPAWGTTMYTLKLHIIFKISIHVPAWGTTCECSYAYSCYTNFNPRSRVGNDPNWCRGDYIPISISIHVPAWGTTQSLLQAKEISKISIHVPAWGTTKCPVSTNWISGYFNPRSRVGNDLFQYLCCILADYFNPRSRVGNDLMGAGHWSLIPLFQSTFPRGERQLYDSKRH